MIARLCRRRSHFLTGSNLSSLAGSSLTRLSSSISEPLKSPSPIRDNPRYSSWPPPTDVLNELTRRQVSLETETLDNAVKQYKTIMEDMVKMGRASQLGSMHWYVVEWYTPFMECIEAELRAINANERSIDRKLYGPFMKQLPADKLAIITMNSVIDCCCRGGPSGHGFTQVRS